MTSKIWLAAAALAVGPLALAQDVETLPGETQQARVDADSGEVTEQELETFAAIYSDLEETTVKFEMELALIETEQEARDLQLRMQREAYEKIEERGWTPEKYDTVIEAVNSDPELLQRALELIDQAP
jgi:hypothetical protein